nr:protein kinase-like domain-containing protein [Tanacetum cinerariifolium]
MSHFGNLSFLRVLSLFNNTFQGTIPNELGRLSRLRRLYIDINKLSGVIPENLSGCSNLRELQLGGNKLVGSIPKEMSLLSKLSMLAISENNLTDRIPPFLGNITSMETFINFSLPDNHLTSSLPSEIGNQLPNLELLQLWGNELTGVLPHSISNCSKLRYLGMSRNDFSGKLTINFSKHYNNFHGRGEADDMAFIDSLKNCTRLVTLGLLNCNLVGMLPISIVLILQQPQNFAWEIANSGSVKSVFKAWEQGLSSFELLSMVMDQMSGPGKGALKRVGFQSSSSSHEFLKPYNSSKTQDVPQPHKSSSRHEILKPSKLSKSQHMSHPYKSVREKDIQLEDEEIQEEVQTESGDVPQSFREDDIQESQPKVVRKRQAYMQSEDQEIQEEKRREGKNVTAIDSYEIAHYCEKKKKWLARRLLRFCEEAAGSGTPAEICFKQLKRVPGHLRGRSAPKKEILAVENLRVIFESEKKKSTALEEKLKEVTVEQDEMKKCMGLMMKEIQRLSKLVPDKSVS